MRTNTQKISIAAMFAALAYALAALSNVVPVTLVPSLPFLNYDPKDVLITIAAFILGPLYAIGISLVSAIVEMLTVSSTGPIGMIMNFLSSTIFAGIAALIYSRKRDVFGAVVGLCFSSVLTTAFMLGWNYVVSPYYMGVPRDVIATMLVPGFLPFNIIKSSINSGIILVIYKPVVDVLRKLGMVTERSTNNYSTFNSNVDERSYENEKYKPRFVSMIVGLLFIILALILVYKCYSE